MAAVNAAWAVLSDEEERRRYDGQLFGAVPSVSVDGEGDLMGATAVRAPFEHPRLRVGLAALLLVILLLIFVFSAYAGAPGTR